MDTLKRKIETTLVAWKEKDGHKPLVIKGCRQCGKTFTVMHFAEAHYSHVVYVNFILKSATLLKSQSVAAQTAKNAIFLVRTDFLPCVG